MHRVVVACLVGTGLSIGFGGAASAADLAPAPAPVYAKAPLVAPAPFSWTGVYFGADGGYAWGTSSGQGENAFLTPGTGPAYSFPVSGAFGGGFVGAQYQWQQLVIGIEADYQAADLKGNSPPTLAGVGAGPYTVSTKVSSYDSVRGRLGFAADRWLVFGTAGLASAHWSTSYAFTGAPAFVTNSATEPGWTAGAGVNYAVWNNVFLSLEYRYTDLKASSFTDPPTNSADLGNKVKINDVRAGVGVKFP